MFNELIQCIDLPQSNAWGIYKKPCIPLLQFRAAHLAQVRRVELCLCASLAYILFKAESDQVTLDLSSKLSKPIWILSNINAQFSKFDIKTFDSNTPLWMFIMLYYFFFVTTRVDFTKPFFHQTKRCRRIWQNICNLISSISESQIFDLKFPNLCAVCQMPFTKKGIDFFESKSRGKMLMRSTREE